MNECHTLGLFIIRFVLADVLRYANQSYLENLQQTLDNQRAPIIISIHLLRIMTFSQEGADCQGVEKQISLF